MTNQKDQAKSFMAQRHFGYALSILLPLTKSDPPDWEAFYLAGQCCRSMQDFPSAVLFLSKANTLHQDDAVVLLALGIALQLNGQLQKAIQELEHAVRLEPTLINAYNSIGLTYRKLGRPIDALNWYSRATDNMLSIALVEATRRPDLCYRDEIVNGEQTRTVLPYLFIKVRSLLGVDPTYSIIKNNIGVCFLELNETESARKAFEESIEFIPEGYNYPDPRKNLQLLDQNT